MGKRQAYRGDPESKLFYLVDQLIGGINTDFSDDTSPDNEFKSIINFNMDKRGSLYKRMGFGKLNAVSEIFNMFDKIPDTKVITPEDPTPEKINDNIVYMKMLRNDNNCFRNLSAFTGEKAYRDYQKIYGGQNNSFELLMITTSLYDNTSTAWTFSCKLPSLEYDKAGDIVDTIEISSEEVVLPVVFNWDRNLSNLDTIEFFDKIYFTGNNKGLVCYDRSEKTFTYNGSNITGVDNGAYKPSPMEIRKVGFNVLGDDPLHWVDYKGINTDSIQGIYLTADGNIPLNVIPSGGKFRLNVLYTGKNGDFNISFKEGETPLTATVIANSTLTQTGLKVYDVIFTTTPTSEVEIKIEKQNTNINPYYDYYEVGSVDPETKPVENINIGDYGICEMYNRAVYYKDDTIWFSEINNFNYVPNYNYVSLPIEPTDKITKVVFFKNVYVVFTKQRIYKMINSFGASDFQVMPVNLSIGCHAPNTVIPIENELYFASPRGIYALRSSEFREGIENLKELDTKIKKLTSDVTMYLGEKSDPSVRYNGIPEKAQAIRYKDKYMIFLNASREQGEIALQDIDVLVYQYDLKAFSEIKFAIKPTFLFMLDGALETFCTIPEKEEYTEEDVILEYDFSEAPINGAFEDKSGNGYNATIAGNLSSNPGTGVRSAGNGANIKTGTLGTNLNLAAGFNLKMICDIESVNHDYLYNLKQSVATGVSDTQTFTIQTDYKNGYSIAIICKTSPDTISKVNTISYTARVYRSSTSIGANNSGKFKLVDANGTVLISETSFNVAMGNALYQDVKTGSFVCQHNSDGSYSKKWTLTFDSYYPVTKTTYINGANIDIDKTVDCTWSSYFALRFKGSTKIANGSCAITLTPYFVMKKGASLSIGERNISTVIDGKTYNSTVGSVSGSGLKEFAGKAFTYTKNYGTATQPTISIDGSYNIKATIDNTYRANVDIDAFKITLPKSEKKTTTTNTPFSQTKNTTITLDTMYNNSYKEIALSISDEHTISLSCTSEYSSAIMVLDNPNVSTLGKHEWLVNYSKTDAGEWDIHVYVDGELFGNVVYPGNVITNANRDGSILFESIVGEINYFSLTGPNSNTLLEYTFVNSSDGTKVIDSSSNKLDGVVNGNITYITEPGVGFDGRTGYLVLPELSDEIRFSNGFSIEFEAKFNDLASACKIIDLATGYNTGENSTDKCSINVGKLSNLDTLIMKSTSLNNKSYSLSKDEADLTNRHKWKFILKDNGKNYDALVYRDDIIVSELQYNYGGITNINRNSNFIGKSNNPNDSLFSGLLYNLKLIVNASANPVPIYVGAIYEYETTYDDFGRPMEISFETKGMNLQYPMHIKKLKNIHVKGLGGFNYSEFFFEVYSDGHLINDPKTYNCYIDEVTGQVVYDYYETKQLTFNEMISLLGNMRLSRTRLGESTYETRKIIVPGKGKNFTVKMYGESSDYLSIESLGFTYKLGKVKEQ